MVVNLMVRSETLPFNTSKTTCFSFLLRELGSRVSCYWIVSYMSFQQYDMFFIHISPVIFEFC